MPARNTNREIAELLGDRVYEGAACKVCKGTERYTNGRACTNCAKLRSAYQYACRPDRVRS
jgi:hypothetical protein